MPIEVPPDDGPVCPTPTPPETDDPPPVMPGDEPTDPTPPVGDA